MANILVVDGSLRITSIISVDHKAASSTQMLNTLKLFTRSAMPTRRVRRPPGATTMSRSLRLSGNALLAEPLRDRLLPGEGYSRSSATGTELDRRRERRLSTAVGIRRSRRTWPTGDFTDDAPVTENANGNEICRVYTGSML